METTVLRSCLLTSMLLSLALPACERKTIEEQRVEKAVERVPTPEPTTPEQTKPEPTTPEPMTPAPLPARSPEAAASTRASNPSEPWTVPAGWTRDPAPRPMRLATYTIADEGGTIEVALSQFGGRVGGELANINRWRGQMGLDPLAEGELEATLKRYQSAGYEGYQTRITSPDGKVMLAAGVFEAAKDRTWFVRTIVPNAAAADRVQDAVFGVARSIAGLAPEGGK